MCSYTCIDVHDAVQDVHDAIHEISLLYKGLTCQYTTSHSEGKSQSEESSWIPDHSNTVVFKQSDITLRVAHNSTAVDHLVRRTFYMR